MRELRGGIRILSYNVDRAAYSYRGRAIAYFVGSGCPVFIRPVDFHADLADTYWLSCVMFPTAYSHNERETNTQRAPRTAPRRYSIREIVLHFEISRCTRATTSTIARRSASLRAQPRDGAASRSRNLLAGLKLDSALDVSLTFAEGKTVWRRVLN